jgi:hypothetical protein
MATIKFLNAQGKYADDLARQTVISYILQPAKTPHRIIGGAYVDMTNPAQSMTDVAVHYGKDSRVRLRHFVLSFNPGEVSDLETIYLIADRLCRCIGMTYQVVYAVHEDTLHPHIHFVFNSISYRTGNRYRGDKEAYFDTMESIKNTLHQAGIFVLIRVKSLPGNPDPNE